MFCLAHAALAKVGVRWILEERFGGGMMNTPVYSSVVVGLPVLVVLLTLKAERMEWRALVTAFRMWYGRRVTHVACTSYIVHGPISIGAPVFVPPAACVMDVRPRLCSHWGGLAEMQRAYGVRSVFPIDCVVDRLLGGKSLGG